MPNSRFSLERHHYMDNRIFDLIPKVIAIFTSLLIFFGIISSVVYYRAFKINILDNITIGEALLLFVSKFSLYAVAVIFGVLISRLYLGSYASQKPENDSKTEPLLKLTLSFAQKLFAFLVVIPLFLLSFMGFSPFVIWILPLSLIIRLFVLSYIIKRLRLVFKYRNIESKFVEYIYVVGISIILIASIAMTEAYLVYTGRAKKSITLYYNDGQIINSDSTTLYLGKSQSFYYLYNKISKKAIFIKADKIDRVDIE